MIRAELLRYAQLGAKARLEQLHQEIDAIYKTFPELRSGRRNELSAGGSRPRMSAAQRKAVSARMTAYWAKRRGDTSTQPAQPQSVAPKHRKVSAEARKRIAEAQRKRWAELKAKQRASGQAESAQQPAAAPKKK